MREWIQRWWAHRKLSNGRCANCRMTLRDDAVTRWCSDECMEDDLSALAW